MPNLYKCAHCKQEKERTLEFFYKGSGQDCKPDGMRGTCKACMVVHRNNWATRHYGSLNAYQIHLRTIQKKKDPVKHVYNEARHRCSNQKDYIALGIQFRFTSLEQFRAELGPKPRRGEWTLDRINSRGHYEPGNIRWAKPSHQSHNRLPFGPSGMKGVDCCEGNRFQARIGYKGKKLNLGRYGTIEEAGRAYDRAARKYYGEHALTNEMLGLLPKVDALAIGVNNQPAH